MAMKTLAKVFNCEESLRGLARSGVSSRGKGGTCKTWEDELAFLSNPMANSIICSALLLLLLFKVYVRDREWEQVCEFGFKFILRDLGFN